MERQNLKSKPGKKSDSHLDEYIDILYGLHYGAFGIFCFVCIFGFTVYGKKLTEIVSEGSQMLKATTVYSSENGYRKGNGSTWRFSEFGSRGKELEVKHRGLKRSVMKIKLIHHIFTIIFFLMGVQLISFACFHDRIMSNLFLSMSYAINALLALLVLDAIILITIASSCVNAFVKTRAKTDNDNSVDLPTSAQISIPLLKLPPAAAIPLQRARESITMSIIQLERGDTGGNRMYV
ncbi:9153_t:CDS:2 [Paraglomus occultum]|uniref:9153_t:CDS:1 n=1 Tax=Paraglomus occultum TaxID=144539 RepID=A0A9N9BAF1_9GLOM|nr:9153_t:CDS:2 [Paraglomus occultum]